MDLRNVSSKRRNPIIADIFNRLNYMDRRGSGFKKILDSYEFQEHYTDELKPQFKSGNSDFWLIFRNLNYGAKDIEDAMANENFDKKENHLGQSDQDVTKMIAEYCKEPHTAKEIMEYFKISDRSFFRRHYLEPMLKNEQLRMTIPDKPKSGNQRYYAN